MKFSTLLTTLFVCAIVASTANCEEATSDEGVKKNDEEIPSTSDATNEDASANNDTKTSGSTTEEVVVAVQTGPFVDLLGPSIYSLEMIDETHAQLAARPTNDALKGKNVVGLYFSADWCGPCRQFTPELVSFYNKMNARNGKTNKFEIVWVSRCRDFDSYGKYFTQMNWLALPPEEAMGKRGQMLSDKYKVKGIPTLVLLDELGNTITTDARNKIPTDKAGIGFPWRNPIARLYMTLLPRSLRHMIRSQISSVKDKVVGKLKGGVGLKPVSA